MIEQWLKLETRISVVKGAPGRKAQASERIAPRFRLGEAHLIGRMLGAYKGEARGARGYRLMHVRRK